MFYRVGNTRYLMRSELPIGHAIAGYSFEQALDVLFGPDREGLIVRLKAACPKKMDMSEQQYRAALSQTVKTQLPYLLGFDADDLSRLDDHDRLVLDKLSQACERAFDKALEQ